MTRLQVTLGNFLVFEKQPRKWSRKGPLEESTFLQSHLSAFAENKYHQQVWPITSIKLVTPTKQLAFTSSTTRLWPLFPPRMGQLFDSHFHSTSGAFLVMAPADAAFEFLLWFKTVNSIPHNLGAVTCATFS